MGHRYARRAARALVVLLAMPAHGWVNTKNPPQPDEEYPFNAKLCKSTMWRGEWGKKSSQARPLGGGKNRGSKEGAPTRSPDQYIICPEDR